MGKKGKKGKKGKRGKSPKKDEKPPRTCITLEDVIAQEAKFNTRLEGIKETKERIKTINSIVKAGLIKKEKDKAWNKYLSCDGLPKASVPIEIRDFLAEWQYFEDMDAKNRCSWLLQVDERSILTQDIDAINNTKKHLKASQEDRGYVYNNHIVRMLTVLDELREVLESSSKISASIYRDLLELKDVMLRSIQGCIDTYTFRLIRDSNGYLNDLDSQTADYYFKSDVIRLHLWTFKHVPINFLPDLWPKKIVNFHSFGTEVILPFAVLCNNLVLRGLHMVYDHYSEYTKSFNMPETSFLDESLDVVLTKEWEKRKELQNDIKAEMIKEREQYEQWAAQKEADEKLKEEQSKRDKKAGNQPAPKDKKKTGQKGKKGKKGKAAGPKYTREPVKLDNQTFPDVENDYLAFFEQSYTEFVNDINPENFKMEEGEINLREYLLMGGVYEFNFVQKPRQTYFPNMIMTWLEHPIVLRYKKRNCFLKEVDFESIGLAKNRERGGMDDEGELDDTDAKPEAVADAFQFNEPPLTFFILTFKVPPEICRWQTPTVCQWYEIAGALDEKQNAFPKSDKDLELRTPVVINDFVLSRTLEIPMMFHIINHLVPRFISIHQFPEELEKRSGAKRKFALEEIEIDEKGDKGEQIVKMPSERLFPVFKAVKPVVIIPMEEGTLNQKDIKNQTIKLFSDYVHELEHIKFTKLPFFKESKKPIAEHEEEETISRKSTTSISSKTRKSLGKSETKKPKSKKRKKAKKKSASGNSSARKSVPKDEVTKMVHFFQSVQSVEEEGEEEIFSHEESEVSLGSDKESVNSKLECLYEIPEHPKWSTKSIFKTEFDDKKYELKVWTNRLGIFAFAFKKYMHLPFRVWTMQPDPENYKIIKYYAESKHAKFCVDITEEGYSVQVLDYKMSKGYPIVLYESKEPFTDIKTLTEQLQSLDMNIFPDRDAIIYLKKTPEKHLPIENHTYECMGLTCMFMQYCISPWNRVSNRRVISIQCRSYDEDIAALETVKITPEETQIVKIKELCTDLNIVTLQFNPTWRNMKYNPDLLSLINSAYFRVLTNLEYERLHNPKLQYNVIKFLKAVRPISFSW